VICIAGEKITRFHKKSLTKNASILRKKENPCFFGKAFFLRKVCAKRKTKITFLVRKMRSGLFWYYCQKVFEDTVI